MKIIIETKYQIPKIFSLKILAFIAGLDLKVTCAQAKLITSKSIVLWMSKVSGELSYNMSPTIMPTDITIIPKLPAWRPVWPPIPPADFWLPVTDQNVPKSISTTECCHLTHVTHTVDFLSILINYLPLVLVISLMALPQPPLPTTVL